jgi:hypothetical protein
VGPRIANWSSYAENTATLTASAPVAVTSTSWVGLSTLGGITTPSPAAPGWDVAGAYARRSPENLETRLTGAGVIPVRAWVRARFTSAGANTGLVRFASGRGEVIVRVAQSTTWAWHTITGWLETGNAPDDPGAVLQDLVRVTGATMQVSDWALDFGHRTA